MKDSFSGTKSIFFITQILKWTLEAIKEMKFRMLNVAVVLNWNRILNVKKKTYNTTKIFLFYFIHTSTPMLSLNLYYSVSASNTRRNCIANYLKCLPVFRMGAVF